VNGVSAGVLGLTVNCARRHDHKFDPIPQRDYYRLQAFFAATDSVEFDAANSEERAARETAMRDHAARLKPIQDRIAEIERAHRERLRQQKQARLEPPFSTVLAVTEAQRTPEQKDRPRTASIASRSRSNGNTVSRCRAWLRSRVSVRTRRARASWES
jgi:hypothetical protein